MVLQAGGRTEGKDKEQRDDKGQFERATIRD